MATAYTIRQKTGLLLGLPLFLICLITPGPADMAPEAHKTLAVTVLMAFWWLTEALPIPATALIPLILFPLLKIMPAQEATAQFGDRNIFLFLGGFFLAAAIEKWGLHRRMALRAICILGTGPKRIVLGMMAATAFLSMWISNTATTVMMLPIAVAIAKTSGTFTENKDASHQKSQEFGMVLVLAIGYAASIGGIGTLIGTPPNIIFAAQVQKLFPNAPEISFFRWFLVGFPLIVVFLPLTWFYLTRIAHPVQLKSMPHGKKVIQRELDKMGAMSGPEKQVMLIFLMTAMAWMFRKNIDIGIFVIPGWSELLGIQHLVHDCTVAIAASVLLFMIPADIKKGKFLLDWKSAARIPWGILLLFGGGLALAHAFQTTGLALWFSTNLKALQTVPILLVILIVVLFIDFLTEITSNTAVASIFMPILAGLSIAMNVHPFLLMIAGTIAASLAFMLPVATPPNAVIFSSGYLTLPQMAKTGFGLNILGMLITTGIIYLLAIPVFRITLTSLPDWIK